MKNTYNAFINNWWIQYLENLQDIGLRIEVTSTKGHAILELTLEEMKKLFQVLNITSLTELKGKSCLALIYNNILKTIGNFMFVSVADIYSDEVKVHLIDSKYWVDYDKYLEYKDAR